MKKVEKVSIAEISFTLDNDAYVALKQYLDSLYITTMRAIPTAARS